MGPSSLTDASVIVIADTSVAINLNATGNAKAILRALPNRVHMAEPAIGELDFDKRTGRRDGELVAELLAEGLITATPLRETAAAHFESLVIGQGRDTLDDGEAATIAVGLETSGFVAIDERKAMRICAERFPTLTIGSTMDILAHDAVRDSLGDKALGDAIFLALRDARMRVLPSFARWAIGYIGRERATACPSLL